MMAKQSGTVRVAVLGAANFSEVAHIPGINAHPKGEVVALYSRDLQRAQEMAEKNGVPEATDNLEALLARDDVDAVTVPSTNLNHYRYSIAALRAGKHVFCEKPMAVNAEQAAEMTGEAKARGLVTPSTPSGRPGATRSPGSTRRPRAWAPRTTSSTWSTRCTGPASA
jgi:predicted dehydrogenase